MVEPIIAEDERVARRCSVCGVSHLGRRARRSSPAPPFPIDQGAGRGRDGSRARAASHKQRVSRVGSTLGPTRDPVAVPRLIWGQVLGIGSGL